MDRIEMPLIEHLAELRKRLLISFSFLGIAFVVLFRFSEHIFRLLIFPLKSELKFVPVRPFITVIEKQAASSLVFLAPAEAFWMHMKVCMVAALIVSLPVIFFQVWRFISPGLVEKEKKYVVPFIFFSSALFLFGALFCFVIVLPFAMTFLLGYKTEHITPMLSVGSYIDFCLKFILAFGAIFELPLVILFLTRFGLITPDTLAKHRRYAVLFAFIAGAMLTPTPDAFNQALMAVPIIILYEIGILLSRILYRRGKNA
ncbi:MAG: twin-arginine translocase subunit TatC [Thermodesulfovibrionales bacterium]